MAIHYSIRRQIFWINRLNGTKREAILADSGNNGSWGSRREYIQSIQVCTNSCVFSCWRITDCLVNKRSGPVWNKSQAAQREICWQSFAANWVPIKIDKLKLTSGVSNTAAAVVAVAQAESWWGRHTADTMWILFQRERRECRRKIKRRGAKEVKEWNLLFCILLLRWYSTYKCIVYVMCCCRGKREKLCTEANCFSDDDRRLRKSASARERRQKRQ